MDYKTVMVGLALDRSNDACLRVAGDIAERFGARVIGVAASDLRPPMYFADGDFAQKLLDEEAAAIERRLSELEMEFRASVEKRATAAEWRSTRSLPVPYMLQQARARLGLSENGEDLRDVKNAPEVKKAAADLADAEQKFVRAKQLFEQGRHLRQLPPFQGQVHALDQ